MYPRDARDPTVGLRVVITRGPFKSYRGIVKESRNGSLRIELEAGRRIAVVEKRVVLDAE
jgi:transcription elongation factor